PARRQLVDDPGQPGLARAGLAGQEHGHVQGGDAADLGHQEVEAAGARGRGRPPPGPGAGAGRRRGEVAACNSAVWLITIPPSAERPVLIRPGDAPAPRTGPSAHKNNRAAPRGVRGGALLSPAPAPRPGYRTSWPMPLSMASAAESPLPKLRDGQGNRSR